MFTGLIEEVGTIALVETSPAGSRLTVVASTVLQGAKLGDSIAIDGACTTVIALDEHTFTIEASPETLDKTTFGSYVAGQPVNLERPLLPSSRIGGHFVTGHVDGKAVVIDKAQVGNSWVFYFRLLNAAMAPLFIEKGSVTVNGISLTVNTVENAVFSVAIIPHTLEKTTMGQLQLDSVVNIEADILGKYVQRLLGGKADGWTMPEGIERVGNSTLHTGSWFNLERLNAEQKAKTPVTAVSEGVAP